MCTQTQKHTHYTMWASETTLIAEIIVNYEHALIWYSNPHLTPILMNCTNLHVVWSLPSVQIRRFLCDANGRRLHPHLLQLIGKCTVLTIIHSVTHTSTRGRLVTENTASSIETIVTIFVLIIYFIHRWLQEDLTNQHYIWLTFNRLFRNAQ